MTAAEIARHSEARVLAERDYRARVLLLDDELEIVSGESRTFAVEVHNLGNDHWPGGPDAAPRIRVGYRWLGRDGKPTREEGAHAAARAGGAGRAGARRRSRSWGPRGAARARSRSTSSTRASAGSAGPCGRRIEVRAPGGRARAKRTSAV